MVPIEGMDVDPILIGFADLVGEIQLKVFAALLPGAIEISEWALWLCEGLALSDAQLSSLRTEEGEILLGSATKANEQGKPDQILFSTSNNDRIVIATICSLSFNGQLAGGFPLQDLANNICKSLRVVQTQSQDIEELRTFVSFKVPLEFRYPASWVFRELPPRLTDKWGVDLSLLNGSETLALIRLERDGSVPHTSTARQRIFQVLCEEFEESGVVSNLTQLETDSETGMEPLNWIGKCILPTGEGHVNIHIHYGTGSWLAVVALCPSREINPTVWLRTQFAFRLAVSSLMEQEK